MTASDGLFFSAGLGFGSILTFVLLTLHLRMLERHALLRRRLGKPERSPGGEKTADEKQDVRVRSKLWDMLGKPREPKPRTRDQRPSHTIMPTASYLAQKKAELSEKAGKALKKE